MSDGGRGGSGRHLVLVAAVMLLLVIGLLPVLSMLLDSVLVDGHISLAAYHGLLTSAHQWTLMEHSLLLATLVTLLTVAVGLPLGILLGRTDLPLRRVFSVLFVVPLLVPAYIIAVSWFDLLGSDGLLVQWLGSSARPLAGVASHWLFGLPGCVAVLFSIFLPIPMLLTLVFLRTVNPRLEEAGRLVCGWRGVIARITVPLILPGVLLAAMLVFLLSFGEFSVPGYLRYAVFPVESFTQFSAFYNFEAATAAAIPLALVTLILLALEAVFLREKTYQLHPFAASERLPPVPLGRYRAWLFVAVALLALVLVVVPLLGLLLQAGGPGTYVDALQRAGDALWRSVLYAVIGASVLSVIGFFIGYLVHTRALTYWRSIDTLTLFLFALPATVTGIGLIGLWNTPWTNLIYATPLIIVFGYVAKYTALSSRITITQLAQIPASMEQAAEVVGAGWWRRMVFIVAPLARRGLVAAWLVGYIFSLRDTGITMLVYPPGYETLPVRIFTLMANGSPQLVAALCVLMIAATLVPVGLLSMLFGIAGKRGAL